MTSPDLIVDTDALSVLGSQLADIVATLAHAKQWAESVAPYLGSGVVADATRSFDDHWKDGRKHLTDNATSLAAMSTQAARTFVERDAFLHQALAGG